METPVFIEVMKFMCQRMNLLIGEGHCMPTRLIKIKRPTFKDSFHSEGFDERIDNNANAFTRRKYLWPFCLECIFTA